MGDLTKANFEAHGQGAETAILLDVAGNVTEGSGFTVFAAIDGVVVSPPRGALARIIPPRHRTDSFDGARQARLRARADARNALA